MDSYLCTFGDRRLKVSVDRLVAQAKTFEVFKNIHTYNEKNLGLYYRFKYAHILNSGTRGYGFWMWKPIIILKSLRKIKENDILVYLDSGCHLNVRAKDKFQEYIHSVVGSVSGLMAINGPSPWPEYPDMRERIWTKGDLLAYFQVLNNREVTETNQFHATAIFIKKTSETIKMISKWVQVIESDINLINDAPSITSNLKGFIEHRHDQSIFSILCKLNGNVVKLPITDTWRKDIKELEEYPIWAIRDKSFSTSDSNHILYKIARQIKRIMKFKSFRSTD